MLIWQLEYMFARQYRLEQLHSMGKRPAHSGQMVVVQVLGPYAMALVVLVHRFTGIVLFTEVAKYWPHMADGKLLRSTDGLAILIGVLMIWWAHRRFNKPERYEPVLKRFRFAEMPKEEFMRDRWFDIGIYLSGIAAVVFTAFKLDVLFVGLLVFIVYANWRICRRFYR